MLKNGNMKCKIIVTYVRKNFVMAKKKKANTNYIIKLEITATTPDNLEVRPTIFVI